MNHPQGLLARHICAVLAVGGGFGALLLAPAAASAQTPRCPTNVAEFTAITWGAPGPGAALSDSDRGDGIELSGLGVGGHDHPPRIVTRRDKTGKGYPLLCASGRIRARLPVLRRGREIQAASVNGRYIAWRETAPGARGTIVRATVKSLRVRAVRRKTVPVLSAQEKDDHRIVTYANGTVGWALAAAGPSSTSRAWAWPRIGSAKYAGLERAGEGTAIRVVDSQNILLSGSNRFLRYSPVTPGRCPKVNDRRAHPLGGWSEVDVAGWGDFGEGGYSSGSLNAVCDPASGKYFSLTNNSSSGYKSDSTSNDVTHQIRNGELLLTASTRYYAGGEYVSVLDTTTDRTFAVPGLVQSPSATYGRDAGPSASLQTIGAVLRPGATAFIYTDQATPPSTQTLRLVDAAGARNLATATPKGNDTTSGIKALAIDGDNLTWTENGAPRSTPISSQPNSPFAVVEP